MDSNTTDGQAGTPSESVTVQEQPAMPSDSTLDPVVVIRLEDGVTRHTWEIRKSLLVKYSGFFRAMLEYDFKKNRDNSVVLHDDDEWALDDLLKCIKFGNVQRLAGYTSNFIWMNHFLHLYLLICKYDCLQFKDFVTKELTARVHDFCCAPHNQKEYGYWLNSHIDAATKHHHAYPVELVSVLAELWDGARAERWDGARRECADCSGIIALLQNDADLASAVAVHYQDKYFAAQKDAETARKKPRIGF